MDTYTLQLSEQCRFHLGDEPYAWQAWFDDSSWEEVTLPHDWSVTLPFSREYSSGTGYLAGGIGWYRFRISPQKEWNGKQISITFDGIYKNSRVWCNSYYLGERPNGYVSFTYDITQFFRFDEDNIICVYVDRRELADSRWFTGSGITRKVSLTIEEVIHPAANGIFFATPDVSPQAASYCIKNDIVIADITAHHVTVYNCLYNKAGVMASASRNSATIEPAKTQSIETSGSVLNPALWSPEAPCLYTLKTYLVLDTPDSSLPEPCDLLSESEFFSDSLLANAYLVDTKKVGIRSFYFDAKRGFFLNNKPYTFKGVCVHHDAGCLGAAVFPAVWHRRLMKLKEMGCNAIRMSHNPHMPELYDLCDLLGFFVMDEAFDEWEGPKNKWSTGHNVYPPKHQGYFVNFQTWHKKDLEDMILRDRNHPSVIMWSIGNEIDYPNDPYCHSSFSSMTGNNDANKPLAERMYNSYRPDATRLAVLSQMLCDIVKETDSTHPVTLAAAFPELSSSLGFIDPLDVVGYNYKEHLYEQHHAAFPDKPILGSENGHGLAQWRAVTDKPYISGQFLWTGIDYLGEAHGWPTHGSHAGLLTLAGFEKTGYYRRQSFWSDKPMVHLATIREEDSRYTMWGEEFPSALACEFAPVGETWNYLPDEKIVVKCYTNLPKVEFFINHKSLGVYEKEINADCVLITLPFQSGELKAVGLSVENSVQATHTLVTTGCSCQLSLTPYKVSEEALPFYIACNTFDAFHQVQQIVVTMLDSMGNWVYSDNTLLHVSVENGTLLGLENGDLADVTDYTSHSRRALHGQLMIYAAAHDASTPMHISVAGEHVKSAQLDL